jgi:hypothetical protein
MPRESAARRAPPAAVRRGSRLRGPHLNLLAHPARGELARIAEVVEHREPIGRLADLPGLLEELAGWAMPAEDGPRTLDLIGHADQEGLLRVGESPLDPARPRVRRMVERIARGGALERLGVGEVRLLGCETAALPAGLDAIGALAELLGVRVLGAIQPIYAVYFGAGGLRGRYERVLCAAGPALAPRADRR